LVEEFFNVSEREGHGVSVKLRLTSVKSIQAHGKE